MTLIHPPPEGESSLILCAEGIRELWVQSVGGLALFSTGGGFGQVRPKSAPHL